MFKSKGQLVIILMGVFSFGLGIFTLLRTPTLILPPWLLVLYFVSILLLISFSLGWLTKGLLKIEASMLTYASVYVVIISMCFYFSEYKPTIEIYVPGDFDGTVMLFVSKKDKNDFRLNNKGIGYVCRSTYKSGFVPKLIKDCQDITDRIIDFSDGTGSYGNAKGGNAVSYRYLSFKIRGHYADTLTSDFTKLIEWNAIDTSRLLKYN